MVRLIETTIYICVWILYIKRWKRWKWMNHADYAHWKLVYALHELRNLYFLCVNYQAELRNYSVRLASTPRTFSRFFSRNSQSSKCSNFYLSFWGMPVSHFREHYKLIFSQKYSNFYPFEANFQKCFKINFFFFIF